MKKGVFIQTKFPAELSVDRVRYCSPTERVARETAGLARSRAHVILVTRVVRERLPRAQVLAKPELDNAAHAEIHTAPDQPPIETKENMVEDWDAHTEVCLLLASISTIPPEYVRPSDKPGA